MLSALPRMLLFDLHLDLFLSHLVEPMSIHPDSSSRAFSGALAPILTRSHRCSDSMAQCSSLNSRWKYKNEKADRLILHYTLTSDYPTYNCNDLGSALSSLV